jgi:hypothetical protein
LPILALAGTYKISQDTLALNDHLARSFKSLLLGKTWQDDLQELIRMGYHSFLLADSKMMINEGGREREEREGFLLLIKVTNQSLYKIDDSFVSNISVMLIHIKCPYNSSYIDDDK